MIRSRLEEKLELPPRRMRENAGEGPILIFANGPRMAGGAGVNQRASTVPAGEQAEKQKQSVSNMMALLKSGHARVMEEDKKKEEESKAVGALGGAVAVSTRSGPGRLGGLA